MRRAHTQRGFGIVENPPYTEGSCQCSSCGHVDEQRIFSRGRVVQESSAIGAYPDALDKPGSSYLWVGPDQHLCREEVSELVACLQAWLETGRLCGDAEAGK